MHEPGKTKLHKTSCYFSDLWRPEPSRKNIRHIDNLIPSANSVREQASLLRAEIPKANGITGRLEEDGQDYSQPIHLLFAMTRNFAPTPHRYAIYPRMHSRQPS